MLKRILWDLDLSEMAELMVQYGQPKYRAGQLFSAVALATPVAEISNLPIAFKARLQEDFVTEAVRIEKILTAQDGTQKILYGLSDGNVVEGVFMRYRYGNTLCVSTQVGCRMNCSFCASGLDGLIRNLTAGEMLGEVTSQNKNEGAGKASLRAVTNLVLMGSGEPLDNYDNVIKFIKLVSSPGGLNISPRNISLSTCGLVPQMLRLADEGLPLNLTVSLHAADDEKRSRLMPVNKSYAIAEVIAAAKHYFDVTKRRIIFEYSLIEGENCSEDSARRLVELLRGLPCHVNLINLNFVKERGTRAASRGATERFLDVLTKGGLSVTVRRSMGADIEGACGQLRRRFLADNGNAGTKNSDANAQTANVVVTETRLAAVNSVETQGFPKLERIEYAENKENAEADNPARNDSESPKFLSEVGEDAEKSQEKGKHIVRKLPKFAESVGANKVKTREEDKDGVLKPTEMSNEKGDETVKDADDESERRQGKL